MSSSSPTLDERIDKEAYRFLFPQLKTQLRDLQVRLREARIPVIVMFDGHRLCGWEDSIKHLTESLDPRGFVVHSSSALSDEEEKRHWLWRFWIRLPAKEKMTLFGNTWYTRALGQRTRGEVTEEQWRQQLGEIMQTERMLAHDGTLIIKIWLDLSRKELKKRFREAEEDPKAYYALRKDDWREYEDYEKNRPIIDYMISQTSLPEAPWHIISAASDRYRRVKVFETLITEIERTLRDSDGFTNKTATAVELPEARPDTRFANADLSQELSQREYEEKKLSLQVKLRRLQNDAIESQQRGMMVVYEGWDASGKGGSIRRLTATLDPQFYDVIPISKPTEEEKSFHYLWRFWKSIPKRGHLTIYDRSWYGRVLVERIEGFCTEAEWKRAYDEINAFEEQLSRAGVMIVKFWIHISEEEQLQRFRAREEDPHKRHKLNDEDWRNRAKWALYNQCVNDMIARTSTSYAPWTIIEGNCKRHARIRAMESVIRRFEKTGTGIREEKSKKK